MNHGLNVRCANGLLELLIDSWIQCSMYQRIVARSEVRHAPRLGFFGYLVFSLRDQLFRVHFTVRCANGLLELLIGSWIQCSMYQRIVARSEVRLAPRLGFFGTPSWLTISAPHFCHFPARWSHCYLWYASSLVEGGHSHQNPNPKTSSTQNVYLKTLFPLDWHSGQEEE